MSKAAAEMMARPDVQAGLSRILRRHQGGVDESAPKRNGRPTDFDPYIVAEAAGMLQMGATDGEVCDAMGISRQTFYKWVRDVPGFADIINSSKAAIKRVEASLFNRAVGKAEKLTTITDADGKVSKRVEKLPPDPRAQHLYLLNRSPDRWRNRTEHELIVPVDDTPALPAEEQDVRKLALAAIALMREAGDAAPLIEASAAAQPDPVSYDDEYEEIEDDEEQDEDFDI